MQNPTRCSECLGIIDVLAFVRTMPVCQACFFDLTNKTEKYQKMKETRFQSLEYQRQKILRRDRIEKKYYEEKLENEKLRKRD